MALENLSRRAILAGAAAVPALALPAVVASASTEPDPIFAAIEAHRDAFMCKMRMGRIYSKLACGTQEYKTAEARSDRASDSKSDAEEKLARTKPTTIAGILALLAYVDDFHCGVFVHPDDPTQWYSGEDGFGTLTDEDIIDRFSGEPAELPFEFWIIRNVRTTLQTLAVQS